MLRFLCILFLSFGSLAFSGEKVGAQSGSKGRFCASKSFAITSQEQPPTETSPDTESVIERFDSSSPSYREAFTKMMLTLLGLIVLIVATVWVLRRVSHGRMKQMNYGRSIKIIERRPLSAKSILYLIEVDGKKVVIAESQLEVRAITTADHLIAEEE